LILCVDIGNTNIKCALGEADNYITASFATLEMNEPSDFDGFIANCFGSDVWGKLKGAALASVVPERCRVITQLLHEKSVPIKRLRPSTCGVDFSRYQSALGEDRAVCAFAAANKYPSPALPLVVIDFGTATTINVVDENKVFLGGAIAAGIQTGINALASRTAQLPPVQLNQQPKLIAGNTTEALVSGAIMGAVCLAQGYVRLLEAELGKEPLIIITGGAAPKVLPFLDDLAKHEPTLLMDGLFMLYSHLN